MTKLECSARHGASVAARRERVRTVPTGGVTGGAARARTAPFALFASTGPHPACRPQVVTS